MKSNKRSLIFAAVIAAGLSGCGGGGGSSGGAGGGAKQTGVLLDAEVEGVLYTAMPSGITGTTNTAGEFKYKAGDVVTFSVGGIEIGSAAGNAFITPAKIAASIDPATLPGGVTSADVALNIAIFLQSFDSDGNPDNGITITPALATAAAATTLDFQRPTDDFLVDPALTDLAVAQGYVLVDSASAIEHGQRTLAKLLAGSWLIDPETESGSSMAILTLLPNGQYVLGIDHIDPNCHDGVEYGNYDIDAGTMAISVTSVDVDNTGPGGDCGLYEGAQGATLPFTLVSSSRMILTADSGTASPIEIVLNRIENSGVYGSWAEPGETGEDLIAVASLLNDGRYMIAQLDADAGVEVGMWTLENGNTLSVNSILTDTNGDTGLSGASGTTLLNVSGWGLLDITAVDGEATMLPLPYRLALPGNSASSVITNSDCPGADGGWTYNFNSTAMEWTGTDSWDEHCATGQEETMQVAYTQEDAPFACGGPACDYFDLNKVIVGTDQDGRPFTSTYAHVPGSTLVVYTKEITGGTDAGDTWTETITLH